MCCFGVGSKAGQWQKGFNDSRAQDHQSHECAHMYILYIYTALRETMPIITLHLTCVHPLPCRIQCYSTAMDLYNLCAINKVANWNGYSRYIPTRYIAESILV